MQDQLAVQRALEKACKELALAVIIDGNHSLRFSSTKQPGEVAHVALKLTKSNFHCANSREFKFWVAKSLNKIKFNVQPLIYRYVPSSTFNLMTYCSECSN